MPGHPSCEGALFCFGAKKASRSPILLKEKWLWRVAAAWKQSMLIVKG